MSIRSLIKVVSIFLLTTLFGWIFVEVLNEFTWMVNGMDDILWAIIYLASVIAVSTFCLVKAITSKNVG